MEQCLCSVQKAITGLQAEVWVIDNASADESLAYLKPRFRWVNFLKNPANTGFANANNQVLQLCTGDYVLFLNPDTLVPEDCFTQCINFMEANPDAGGLGVRMVDGSGIFLPESKRSFPSPLTSLFKLSGLSNLFPKSSLFARYALGHLDPLQNHKVDVLAGAFLLAKRSLLLSLNGFDEAFFMYGEDIDLSYRIQQCGYHNYYFGGSTIIHFKGESTKKGSLNYVRMFYKAMSIFVKKHYGTANGQLFAYIIQLAIWSRAVVSFTKGIVIKNVAGSKDKLYTVDSFLIRKGAVGRNEHTKQSGFLIIGAADECMAVKEILEQQSKPAKKIMCLSLPDETGDVSNFIDKLHSTLQHHVVSDVIFCHGKLGYGVIISLLHLLPKQLSIWYHAYQSKSIIGSDSKNSSGTVIVLT